MGRQCFKSSPDADGETAPRAFRERPTAFEHESSPAAVSAGCLGLKEKWEARHPITLVEAFAFLDVCERVPISETGPRALRPLAGEMRYMGLPLQQRWNIDIFQSDQLKVGQHFRERLECAILQGCACDRTIARNAPVPRRYDLSLEFARTKQ